MNIFLILSIVWQALFTGGQFRVVLKNGDINAEVYEVPAFNHTKYKQLDPQDYYLTYEWRVIQRSGNDIVLLDTTTTSTKLSVPKVREQVTVILQVHPRGLTIAAGDGQPYIAGQIRLKQLVVHQDLFHLQD